MLRDSSERARITGWLKRAALAEGFSQVGICPAASPTSLGHFEAWLDAGYHGEMDYLSDRGDAYRDPALVLPSARSIVMLTLDYRTLEPAAAVEQRLPLGTGRVSRYAWGERDYHDVIRERLHRLADGLRSEAPEAQTRGVVDTAPLLERDYARQAGLGWFGKNTLLLSRQGGSWFFLAGLLTDLELDYDQPHTTDHCGTCTACLDACPTEAFVGPRQLDARKCISYLTIELRSPIPQPLRGGIQDWVFGCDVCQEVCPWQSKSRSSVVPEFEPRAEQRPLDLLPLFELDEAGFRARFRKTPIWRAHREGLLRNAAIVLGNQRDSRAIPTLIQALDDPSPLVRGACVWAIGQMPTHESRAALEQLAARETDPHVLEELRLALATPPDQA